MSPKTSPAPRTDATARGRTHDVTWPLAATRRGRDDLARFGLVDVRTEPLDPREALTDLRLGDGSPDRRDLPGIDVVWETHRII